MIVWQWKDAETAPPYKWVLAVDSLCDQNGYGRSPLVAFRDPMLGIWETLPRIHPPVFKPTHWTDIPHPPTMLEVVKNAV